MVRLPSPMGEGLGVRGSEKLQYPVTPSLSLILNPTRRRYR